MENTKQEIKAHAYVERNVLTLVLLFALLVIPASATTWSLVPGYFINGWGLSPAGTQYTTPEINLTSGLTAQWEGTNWVLSGTATPLTENGGPYTDYLTIGGASRAYYEDFYPASMITLKSNNGVLSWNGGPFTTEAQACTVTGSSFTCNITPAVASGDTTLVAYDGTDGSIQMWNVSVTNPAIPIAHFAANHISGLPSLTYQFNDTSSLPLPSPESWQWSFGDGGTSTVQNPLYTYANPGAYNVSLTVTDAAGSNTTVQAVYVSVTGTPSVKNWGVTPVGTYFSSIDIPLNSGLNATWKGLNWTLSGTTEFMTGNNYLSIGGAYRANNEDFYPTGYFSLTSTYGVLSVNGIFNGANCSVNGNTWACFVDPRLTGGYSTLVVYDGNHGDAYLYNVSPTNPLLPIANFNETLTAGPPSLTYQFDDISTAGQSTSWNWSFGDGGTSSVQNPLYTYANPGVYNVTLTDTNAAGSNTITKAVYVSVTGTHSVKNWGVTPVGTYFNSIDIPLNSGLNATWKGLNWTLSGTTEFMASSDGLLIGGAYRANNEDFYPNAYFILTSTNGVLSVNSIFNGANCAVNGNTWSCLVNPKLTGGYTTLVIYDGTSGDAYLYNVSPNDPFAPIPNFNATPTSGPAPLPVQFLDTSTGSPTSWNWSFGDGGGSNVQNPTYTYANPGTYTVSLTATNAAGSNTTTLQGFVNVTNSLPVANFTGSPISGTAPTTVKFTDTSTGSPTSWNWSFGDGGTSNVQNPTYTYANPGTYTVSMTATNAAGSSTMTQQGFETVTTVISTQATDIEGMDLSEYGLPKLTFIADAATKQQALGYNAEAMYYDQTNDMDQYIESRISNDSIFNFHGHGVTGGGIIVSDNDELLYYYASGNPSSFNFDNIASYSNMSLAIFDACQSGLTSPVNGNFVDVIANKGGRCVMGWTADLWFNLDPTYQEEFWNAIEPDASIDYAHNMAIDAVESNITCQNDYQSDPFNYTSFCNYDDLYSKGPDCDLPLPSFNTEQSSEMEQKTGLAANNINIPSEIVITQEKNAIQLFTQKPTVDLKFKNIIHQPNIDLYEFKGANSSGYLVNGLTGRVQAAVWDEPVSKNMKEIIDLNHGEAIAESYAKQQYPELWNISDIRGIKLERMEILDLGGYRQLCYTWGGILYNSNQLTGQRDEINDGNEVTVIINPYTGHVINYDEKYYPSVFSHTSLVNLTPMITEEQAWTSAKEKFNSYGINVEQSDYIKSLGLKTIIGEDNIPHLTWSFEMYNIENWGTERAFVSVDTQDGHIVWSQPYD
jgi:PKD repeat protein